MTSATPTRVLLIDDDEDDRTLFFSALKSIDLPIVYQYEENGLHALRSLRDGAAPLPHYIFLDLNMPLMNGKEFLTLLKLGQDLLHIPVAVLTTSSMSEDKIYAQKHGAAYFITKPVRRVDLIKAINIVLQNDHNAGSSEHVTKF